MRLILITHVLIIVLTACNPNPPSVINYADVPREGDVAQGEILFTSGKNSAPPCILCHIPESPASPDLAGFAERADSQVEGQSAHEYAFYSITEPAQFIAEGYGNAMYNQYDEIFTPQEIADLIAYLLTL
ncbi:MAG: cytochrome c [Anaerolineae bacterium]|nr:cytochrome c [Anaerolineae bacterium]